MRQGSYLSSFVQFMAQIFFFIVFKSLCNDCFVFTMCGIFAYYVFEALLQMSLSGGRAFKIPSSLATLCILTLDLVSDCPKSFRTLWGKQVILF